ncbi:diaminopropionate ammonia-lyase [Pectinatus haikarae]|uniref:diaminopropionate ammonia-lyase n=1 Tax=Pectinatus haikarae TaxID=349096 RepID=UPI0018C6B5F7|nr:diaminopropionate ammonia-lyase [Pectinatus haikarae]
MQLTAFTKGIKNINSIDFLNREHADKVLAFHKSFPMYKETPLVELKEMAALLGIKNFFVKDESYRFGLNAFKVLGGSFAIGSYIAKKLGMDISELSFEKMISPEIKGKLGSITFVTATDGNHGRGVAWTARQLGQKAVVYMPKGSSKERFENIKAEGADVTITDLNYDDAVRLANSHADEYGWVMVQDTSWKGYQDIPKWIIQGYGTMALEAYKQLPEKPTHIFIQAGVGALAGAVTGFFANVCKGKEKPIVTIVEPDTAACIFDTAKADDGRLHFVGGSMNTMMAGLACGEPCDIGWKVLAGYADFAIACADNVSAKGMRALGAPLAGDKRIISGESGAAPSGAVMELLMKPEYAQLCGRIGLNQNSVVLCFSTEGATDKKNYQSIVWDGKEASCTE